MTVQASENALVNPVGMAFGPASYSVLPPFSPCEPYPEYPHRSLPLASGQNSGYEAVRTALLLLGADADRFGRAEWNPLGSIIEAGQTVVIKPNLVRHFRDSAPEHDDCLVAHGSIIRAIVDYVYIALRGHGRIVIADAPHSDADFPSVRAIASLDAVVEFYGTVNFPVEVYDLRPEAAMKIDGVIVGHRQLPGDPAGYLKIDLGPHSAFSDLGDLCELLYGSEYERGELVSHHSNGRHEYLIARTILNADCVISVPKLKTHKKTGLTATLKNLVGINGNKNWLPHHREGTPSQGGDQFAESGWVQRSERMAVAAFKRTFPLLGPLRPVVAAPIKSFGKRVFGDTAIDTIRSGNWYGNDTTWRMVHDLNRILLYADSHGRLHEAPQRRVVSLVDGIIAGEGNGPLDPIPKPAGLVVAAWNAVACDAACARSMGFDRGKLPMLAQAFSPHRLPLILGGATSIRLVSNRPAFHGDLDTITGTLRFLPHFGWRGHIELELGEG